MRARLIIAAFAALLIAANPLDDAVKKEREKLNGTWVLLSFQTAGTKRTIEGVTLTFDGDKMVTKAKSSAQEGTYTIDPTRNPKEMTWLTKGMGSEKSTTHALYTLDGDTLTVCTGPTVTTTDARGKDTGKKPLRPAKLDPSAGTVHIFKREKK